MAGVVRGRFWWQGDVSFATSNRERGHTAPFIGRSCYGMSPRVPLPLKMWQTKRPLATRAPLDVPLPHVHLLIFGDNCAKINIRLF